MQRNKVLLPEPDEPMKAMTSLWATSMEMPLSTDRVPKDLCTSSSKILGVIALPSQMYDAARATSDDRRNEFRESSTGER